jgi:hypothetical protein
MMREERDLILRGEQNNNNAKLKIVCPSMSFWKQDQPLFEVNRTVH